VTPDGEARLCKSYGFCFQRYRIVSITRMYALIRWPLSSSPSMIEIFSTGLSSGLNLHNSLVDSVCSDKGLSLSLSCNSKRSFSNV